MWRVGHCGKNVVRPFKQVFMILEVLLDQVSRTLPFFYFSLFSLHYLSHLEAYKQPKICCRTPLKSRIESRWLSSSRRLTGTWSTMSVLNGLNSRTGGYGDPQTIASQIKEDGHTLMTVAYVQNGLSGGKSSAFCSFFRLFDPWGLQKLPGRPDSFFNSSPGLRYPYRPPILAPM